MTAATSGALGGRGWISSMRRIVPNYGRGRDWFRTVGRRSAQVGSGNIARLLSVTVRSLVRVTRLPHSRRIAWLLTCVPEVVPQYRPLRGFTTPWPVGGRRPGTHDQAARRAVDICRGTATVVLRCGRRP